MSKLILKYERRNFFGNREYTEDTCNFPKLKDLQAVMRYLKKDNMVAVSYSGFTLFWDSFSNFENGIVSVRYYDAYGNYTEEKKSFEIVKKEVYGSFKTEMEESNREKKI